MTEEGGKSKSKVKITQLPWMIGGELQTSGAPCGYVKLYNLFFLTRSKVK